MTANQTIDGVPLLPCPFCGVVPKPFSYPRYAPVEVTCDDEGCPAFSIVVSRDDWNKRAAAQPQGDTVPVSAHWSDWSMVTLEIEGQHRTYVEYGEPKAKPVAWKTGSITWAYEPDARRHGERHGVLVKPLFDRPLYAAQPQGGPLSELEVLRAAVKELEAMRDARVAEKLGQPQGEPVHMVRSHGSDCWEEITGESLEICKAQPEEYEVRTLYAEQPAPVAVTYARTPFEIEHDAEPGDEAAFRKWRDERSKK